MAKKMEGGRVGDENYSVNKLAKMVKQACPEAE